MRNFAGFVQDRASYSRVTLNLGLRWSYYDGKIPAQTGGGGKWFPVTSYPEIDPGYSWNTLAPRTGIVFKLTEDGKNVAKASYSRYYESMYTSEYASINPNSIQTGGVQTWSFLGDLNGNGKADRNELGTLQEPVRRQVEHDRSEPEGSEERRDHVRVPARAGGQLVVQRRLDPALVPRRDDRPELLRAAVQHRGVHGLRADARRHRLRPGQHPRHRRRPHADLLRRAAGSTSARTRSSTPTAATTSPSTARSATRRLEFSVEQADVEPLADAGLVRVVAPRRRAAGHQHQRHAAANVYDYTNPNNMLDSSAQGRGANDQPHAFKLLGSYQAPWGINVGANFQALSGLPIDRTLTVRVRAGLAQRAGRAARHLPRRRLNLLSLRADKGVRFSGHRASFVAELHNVLNSSAGQSSYGALTQSFASQAAFDAARATTSYFGRMQEIVAPRVMKIGFKFDF